MSARLDPTDARLLACIVARREEAVRELRVLEARVAELDDVIALLRRGGTRPYDTVPASDVAETVAVPPERAPEAPKPPPRKRRQVEGAKRATDETVAKVRAVMTPPPGNSPARIVEKSSLSVPAVRRALARLIESGEVERSGGKRGLGVRYALKVSPDEPAAHTPRAEAPKANGADTRLKAAPAPKMEAPAPRPEAPPVAPRAAKAASKSHALTGNLIKIAEDVLAQLSTGPKSEAELFRKTAWPVGTIRTVVAALKAEGKVTGSDKLSLAEARE